jgi:uncharacterized protein DUF4105
MAAALSTPIPQNTREARDSPHRSQVSGPTTADAKSCERSKLRRRKQSAAPLGPSRSLKAHVYSPRDKIWMMHYFKVVCCLIWFGLVVLAASQETAPAESEKEISAVLPQLGEMTEISLVTYTQGEELYQTFGHSAIRIKDDALGIDRLYGFGTFDFETPNFGLKFAHGDLLYQLGVTVGDDDIREVGAYGQGVSALPLNLTNDQKQRLFEALEINLLPENRTYRYDFALDNCSTRIRDAFEKLTGSPIQEPGAGKLTFRRMVDVYFNRIPWTHFGVDLLLGSTMDRVASAREACFLPADLERAVQASRNGDQPLTGAKQEIFPSGDLPQPAWFSSPMAVFLIGGALWFMIWLLRRRGHARWLSALYFTIYGSAGVFVCFISFWSRHWVVRENYNQLWLIPTHLLLGIALFFGKPKIVVWYLRFAFVAAAAFVAFSTFLPQKFEPAVYPLVILLAWRSLLDWRFGKDMKAGREYEARIPSAGS